MKIVGADFRRISKDHPVSTSGEEFPSARTLMGECSKSERPATFRFWCRVYIHSLRNVPYLGNLNMGSMTRYFPSEIK